MSVHRRRAATGPWTRVGRFRIAGAVALSALTVVVLARPSGSDAQVQAAHASVPAPVVARQIAAEPQHLAAPDRAASSVALAPPAAVASASAPTRPVINACRHNEESKQVLVSLADQHMWLCARHHPDADFPITTGRSGDATPTGTYEVQALTRDTTLNPDSGGSYSVRYWIPFKWGMFGFHDAPWQTIPFGSPRYRTKGSQGCVHMRTADIAHLFHWVALGTIVRVIIGRNA